MTGDGKHLPLTRCGTTWPGACAGTRITGGRWCCTAIVTPELFTQLGAARSCCSGRVVTGGTALPGTGLPRCGTRRARITRAPDLLDGSVDPDG